jgi:hypothetical protein
MNKPLFDALLGMSQARSAFDERVLSALETFMKGEEETRAATRTPIPVLIPSAREGGLILLKPGQHAGPITEQVSWTTWKMVGFGLSGDLPETVQISCIQCHGGMNLLWHEDWTPLRAYQENPVSLRETPIVKAPNCVTFSVRNVGTDPVQFALWAIGEPVGKQEWDLGQPVSGKPW